MQKLSTLQLKKAATITDNLTQKYKLPLKEQLKALGKVNNILSIKCEKKP